MASDHRGTARRPIQPFFETLLGRDASGASWLPQLLAAAPYGRSSLGELVDAPGWLVTPLAVRGAGGRLACFDYPAAPSRELLRWFIDHPDRLTWVDDAGASAGAVRLRRALVLDDPPGSQVRAQERARELLRTRSGLAPEWWRFEEPATLDCVLITGRLVVTIVTGDRALRPSTPWYPHRTELVRALEAAGQMAAGRRWASLVLAERPDPGLDAQRLARALPQAAPHRDDPAREADLLGAFLGAVTWQAAGAAVGIPEPALPHPTGTM